MEPKIFEIAEALKNQVNKETAAPGLLTGMAGISLFYYELGKVTQKPEYGELAEEFLGAVFAKINNGFDYPTFSGGLAGIGWLVKYYVNEGFLAVENLGILSDLDDYLCKSMLIYLDDKYYDYLHGAIGIGLYFLSRLPDSNAITVLEKLVNGLAKIAIYDDAKNWCYWEVINKYDNNSVSVDTSLTHGMTSVIIFLGRCIKNNILTDISNKLLNSSIKYLLDNRNTLDKESYLPNFLVKSENISTAKFAWCYGDLGSCTALIQTAKIIEHEELLKTCIDAIIKATSSPKLEPKNIKEPSICIGASGLALISLRNFKNTGLKTFNDSAEFWKERALLLANRDEGVAGYQAWNEVTNNFSTEYGILIGAAGIGLTLLAFEKKSNQKWDEILLLS